MPVDENALIRAQHEYLIAAKDQIFDLFIRVVENFDGSDYQQGKKDGLRLALSLLGVEKMEQDTREVRQAREARMFAAASKRQRKVK